LTPATAFSTTWPCRIIILTVSKSFLLSLCTYSYCDGRKDCSHGPQLQELERRLKASEQRLEEQGEMSRRQLELAERRIAELEEQQRRNDREVLGLQRRVAELEGEKSRSHGQSEG
jgi:hypothetical protein